ncbi:MAG: hypothetical protein IKU39_01645 [Lachnospiraceae bacterium]|nr:hypothetical protein [Lachnospiraceae bacterium]
MKKRKGIKKTISDAVLGFSMVLCLSGMVTTMAKAEGNSNEISHTHTETESGHQAITLNDTAWKDKTYYLSGDMTLGSIAVSGTVNLCLNGHILTADTVTVSSGATLNIYDCGNTVHKYQSSENGSWVLNENGNEEIAGGILSSKIINQGNFHLNAGTICGMSGIVITNKVSGANVTIAKNGAVIGNFVTGNTANEGGCIIYNGYLAKFVNEGEICYNVASLHTVRNDGGTFINKGMINNNIAYDNEKGTTAGGVANFAYDKNKPSIFHNYGQINSNRSARSSGGVLNKGGEFTNHPTGQINDNVAARHCGGVDNTSKASNGDFSGTFFKNYGQVNNNEVTKTHWANERNEGGTGAGIYNEESADIYNYGEVCNNTAVDQGGGIYFAKGRLYVGGASKVTGNTDGAGNDSNICVASDKAIEFVDTADSDYPNYVSGKLTQDARMGVYYLSGEARTDGPVSSEYTQLYDNAADTYFFADTTTQKVVLKENKVYLHTHSMQEVPATVTCTEPGNIAYYECTGSELSCGLKFLDAQGDTPVADADVTVGALGHNMSAATCEEVPKCQREGCNHTEGSALGHDMGAATCEEAPKCKREGCNHTEGSALGHNMSAATCEEAPKCKREGCDHTEGAALDHDWSGPWKVIKKATATEEGKKETYCVRSCGQKKIGSIPASGAQDIGNLEKYTQIASNGDIEEITLNNSKDELVGAKSNIFDSSEKSRIENGESASVWLDVKEIDAEDETVISKTERVEIEKKAIEVVGEDANITYFDANLFKQIGASGRPQKIETPGIPIKITLLISEELLNSDKTKVREYKILRLHDRIVDVISGEFNPNTGEFTFETDRFSKYAIIYKDAPAIVDDDDDDDDADDDESVPNNAGTNDSAVVKIDEVPLSGDDNALLHSVLLMLLSGLGIFCVIWKRNRKY